MLQRRPPPAHGPRLFPLLAYADALLNPDRAVVAESDFARKVAAFLPWPLPELVRCRRLATHCVRRTRLPDRVIDLKPLATPRNHAQS